MSAKSVYLPVVADESLLRSIQVVMSGNTIFLSTFAVNPLSDTQLPPIITSSLRHHRSKIPQPSNDSKITTTSDYLSYLIEFQTVVALFCEVLTAQWMVRVLFFVYRPTKCRQTVCRNINTVTVTPHHSSAPVKTSRRGTQFAMISASKPRTNLTESMTVFLSANAMGATLSVPYTVYLTVEWRPITSRYNVHVMYWTGLFFANVATCSSISVFFLTIDRCLILMEVIAVVGKRRIRHMVAALSVLTLLVAWAVSVYFIWQDRPSDDPVKFAKIGHCRVFACLMVNYLTIPQLIIKFSFGGLNLLSSVYFFYLLRRRNEQTLSTANRIVKATIFVEICCSTLPNFLGIMLNYITGISSQAYLGPYTATLCNIEMTICAAIYSRNLLRSNNNNASGTKVQTIVMNSHSSYNSFHQR